ncbi:NAD(P)H-hydrate dehydratase [Radiobacillus deserti]|uniref:Bifunctional NAD(P)H-hydrate repair enzyme n=1 Tax=Radiobacillus deserti TaxID=2594883 RepID=A0A516KCL1_9BACI|nr:NAD(P)H-hydrate dehydratase [Radiobacillus deserti]QDP39148.1 NAD(P)H-hydrate dehydratase [Radiobacillus deserti]
MHIVTAKEMYEIDRITMEEYGLDGRILMENAGRAIAKQLEGLLSLNQRITILVGSGNNGGDGFVIGRTMMNAGYSVRILQLVEDNRIRGDAQYHKQLFLSFGGTLLHWNESFDLKELEEETDVWVDAMLGIGAKGALRSPFSEVCTFVNRSERLTVSVDIPSGIPADEESGYTEEAIHADITYIIEAPKLSTFLERYASYYGRWEVVRIGIPNSAWSFIKRAIWSDQSVQQTLPTRSRFSHKGSHGRGFVIGGSQSMPGSVALTSSAALRAGAGLLTIGTVPEAIPSIAAQLTEATFHAMKGQNGWIQAQELDLSPYDSVVIGMGMGRAEETASITRQVVKSAHCPLLIDADGLYHIQHHKSSLRERSHPTVLTPHPGEMAMLSNQTISSVLDHPISISKTFAMEYGVYLVLKGPFTIITTPDGEQWVNLTGNAGLAKGGSGDALAGVLLTMMMQHETIQHALSNGCYLHGKSADYMVEHQHSDRDLLATDVIHGLIQIFRTLSS